MQQETFPKGETHYLFPIPSREAILNFLTNENKPVNKAGIAKAFDLNSDEEADALHRRLRAMEKAGQLVFTRRKCYALPEKLEMLKGSVIGHREGYGFLNVEDAKRDLFIPVDQMKEVMHGDSILAQPLSEDRKGRNMVRVVRILEPADPFIVGRYYSEAGTSFVVPNDDRIHLDILVPHDPSYKQGTIVVVELLKRPPQNSKTIGRIVNVLGEEVGRGVAIEMAIHSHKIPVEWSDDTVAQAKTLTDIVSESDKQHRVDLRQLPLVTIDGEDARDFDDALYCEQRQGGGWRLWVAIADVSHYVHVNSPIDRDAAERMTSVYFPTMVVPMLPEVISNGLCSLNPHVDRLCFVCEMTISSTGKLTAYRFYNAVMNSHARLTYTEVDKILKNEVEDITPYAPLVAHLTQLHALYNVRADAKVVRGAISFDTEEMRFVFNDAEEVERIERITRNDAHKLVEECMILANIAAAKFVEAADTPALYRIHEPPSEESLDKLSTVLGEIGLTSPIRKKAQPRDIANFLSQIADRPDHEMLQTMVLRSMNQAVYSSENKAHFGLALKSYSHFTSPIRRYPDLLLHRAIKSVLAKGPTDDIVSKQDAWAYTEKEMTHWGMQCSMAERRADDATRDVVGWLKCDYMQHHVGSVFSGVITSVMSFGFFVRLDDLSIDGLVHVSSLDNEYYTYDPVRQFLSGETTKQCYRLGNKVEIRVAAVHLDERKIDFIVTGHEQRLASQRTNKRSGNESLKLAVKPKNQASAKKPQRRAKKNKK